MNKKMEMEIVNPHCAGIDVGSKSHYVAIGQMLDDVREFGVYADDLTAVCQWLKESGIISVAMESTGSYWQNLNNWLRTGIITAGNRRKKLPGH